MDAKEGKTAVMSFIDSICEQLSEKDKIEVLQNTYQMVDMYLEDRYQTMNETP